jgi:hypothetical protein
MDARSMLPGKFTPVISKYRYIVVNVSDANELAATNSGEGA